MAPLASSPARTNLHEWLGYIATEVHKGFAPLFGQNSSDEDKAAAVKNLSRRLDYIDAYLGVDKNHLVDGTFSIADAYLFVVLNWTFMVGISLDSWTNLSRFYKEISMRDAVQETLKVEGLI